MCRFLENSKRNVAKEKPSQLLLGNLSCDERERSIILIVKQLQSSISKPVLKSLTRLTPFTDEDGLIRLGGRLHASALSFDTKHPMLLPRNPITKLLVKQIHLDNQHAPPQMLLAIVRQRFWPLQGKGIINSVYRECIPCFRNQPRELQQLMGNLPESRVTPLPVFYCTGVDMAGPFYIHHRIRGKAPTKAYIAVFVCFSTKAVHIEVVSDLTTEAFLGCLKRFISRRGRPAYMYSDNGTNFIGTREELIRIQEFYNQNTSTFGKVMTDKGIIWHTIPARSPHFGGIWEAAVKQAKRHLKVVVGNKKLTAEEFNTVVTEVEAVLNSRPITPISNNPNDLAALTPGHFVIHREMTALPDRQIHNNKRPYLEHWKAVSLCRQEFWKRWRAEYLTSLQTRAKWQHQHPNIEEGALVLLKDEPKPPLKWQMGRVIKIYKGDDDLVRVADVQTEGSIKRRAVHLLCPLPTEDIGEIEQEPESEPVPIQEDVSKSQDPVGMMTRSRRKAANPVSMVGLLLLCLTIPFIPVPARSESTSSEVKIVNFDDHPGVYFDQVGKTLLQTQEWHLISYFNMTSWKIQGNGIQGLLDEARTVLVINTDRTYMALIREFEARMTDIVEMNQFLSGIKPEKKTRRRRGAIDIVGNIANKLFGVLDNEYAANVENVIDKLKTNDDHLVHLMRNQTTLIQATLNIMKNSTDAIDDQFRGIKNDIDRLRNRSEELSVQVHTNSLFTHIALLISRYRETQLVLKNIVTHAQHGRMDPLLLTPEELTQQLRVVALHVSKDRSLPPFHSIDEMYLVMDVAVTHGPNCIIFNIEIPILDTMEFSLLHVVPVPTQHRGKMVFIKPNVDYIAISHNRKWYYPMSQTDVKECTNWKDAHLCQEKHPRFAIRNSQNEYCEVDIFLQLHEATCPTFTTNKEQVWIQLSNPNFWIFSVSRKTSLNIQCNNNYDRVIIHDEGMVVLNPDCTIENDGIIVHGYKSINQTSTLISPFSIPKYNISDIIGNRTSQPSDGGKLIMKKEDISNLLQIAATLKDEELPNSNWFTPPDVHHYFLYGIVFIAITLTLGIKLVRRKGQPHHQGQHRSPKRVTQQPAFTFGSDVLPE